MPKEQDASSAAPISANRFGAIPPATGRHFAVAAGHELGAEAGLKLWRQTGNVIDAAVAATLVLGVVEPHLFGLGGEVTGLVHIRGETKVLAGATRAPAAMTLQAFADLGVDPIPGDGLLAAGPPAVLHSLLLMLVDHGSASFSKVAAPAIDIAEKGFAIGPGLVAAIKRHETNFKNLWPTSAEIWMPQGVAPQPGMTIRQPGLAETLRRLSKAGDAGGSRSVVAELRTGFVANELAQFAAEPHPSTVGTHSGFLRKSDLERFEVRWEKPIAWTDRQGRTIYKAGPWSQGPTLLEHFAIMQAGDWDLLPVGDSDFFHATLESLKLAMADREGYFGDPAFVDVPLQALLSSSYAAERARLIDMGSASDPGPGIPEPGRTPWVYSGAQAGDATGDTTHLDLADAEGTLIALTPSGGWFGSPVIPELGFPLGTRCQTFWLDPDHPNVVVPEKRPRTTLTPTLVLENGRPRFALGTPGGDTQDQIQAQMIHALGQGSTAEEAVDLATVITLHPPSSFYPHGSEHQVVLAESRVGREAIADLRSRGHEVRDSGSWSHGRPQVLEVENSGRLKACVSRRTGTAGIRAE